MTLHIDVGLTVTPARFPVPMTVDTLFWAHRVEGTGLITVRYWLDPEPPFWFEVGGTRSKEVTRTRLAIRAGATDFKDQLSLECSPGAAIPAESMIVIHTTIIDEQDADRRETSKRVVVTNALLPPLRPMAARVKPSSRSPKGTTAKKKRTTKAGKKAAQKVRAKPVRKANPQAKDRPRRRK